MERVSFFQNLYLKVFIKKALSFSIKISKERYRESFIKGKNFLRERERLRELFESF
jgi:hypothetical protein